MAHSSMPGISRETLVIVGATIALAALIHTSTADIRSEIRAIRAEAHADRESFRSRILRLTEQQGVLGARLDGLRTPPAPNR